MKWLLEHYNFLYDQHVQEKIVVWVAWHLPRELVYWCAIRLLAHATTGKWSDQIATELMAIDALERWDNKNDK